MFQNYPFSTGQVTVTAAATLIVAANAARSGLLITNTGTTVVYIIENTSGTASTGQYLAGSAGASLGFSTTEAVYGITGGGSATVTYLQTQ
jgi:hypothetical protein